MHFDLMKNKQIIQRTAAVLLALVVWQLTAAALDSKVLLVSPLSVLLRLLTLWREPGFIDSIRFTMARIALGFMLGFVCGVALAALSGRFPVVENLIWPFMITIKTVPVASFIIIALIWLSSRNLSVFISFLMVVPVIYNNVLSGIRAGDRRLDQMAVVFRLPWYRKLIYIRLPQLRPYFFSACSTALGLSWKAGVAAEIIGIPEGSVGEKLYMSKIYLDTDDLFAWTVVIVVISFLFEKLVVSLFKLGYRRLEKL